VVDATRKLPVKSAIIDGEAVVQNEIGGTDFSAL
jgi:ATP-dependent DNA ligase